MNKWIVVINTRKSFLIFFIVAMLFCQFRMASKQGYILLPVEFVLGCFFLLLSFGKNKMPSKESWLYFFFIVYRIFSSLVIAGADINSVKTIFYRELGIFFMCWFFMQNISGEWLLRKIRDVGFFLSSLGVWEFITKDSLFMQFITVESRIYMEASIGTIAARVRTIFVHPIICGVITTVFWLCILSVPYKNKWMNLGAKVAIVVSLLGTQARSSWLSFFIVTIIYLWMMPKKNVIKFKTNNIYQLIVLVFLILIILGIFYEEIYDNFIYLINRGLQAFDLEHKAGYNRITMLRIGLHEWLNFEPLEKMFGAGGGYAYQYLQYNSIRGWTTAVDNQYLTVLLDFGLIGLLLMLGLLLAVFIKVFSRKNRVISTFALCLLSMFISGFFYEMFSWPTVTLLFSLCLAAMGSENRTRKENCG